MVEQRRGASAGMVSAAASSMRSSSSWSKSTASTSVSRRSSWRTASVRTNLHLIFAFLTDDLSIRDQLRPALLYLYRLGFHDGLSFLRRLHGRREEHEMGVGETLLNSAASWRHYSLTTADILIAHPSSGPWPPLLLQKSSFAALAIAFGLRCPTDYELHQP
ncbi:hypothetical protein OsJ_35588 [Oryza sativa Japonica Group]|uniref:Uncharacterized protein n=1 Tax=Oryza sativa subsp. japonica TaxID=39947 RepID=B9GCE6_ORYSJ|nr:hypothetical protein OsJ_35588 [Oryza sativa Japonica Group]